MMNDTWRFYRFLFQSYPHDIKTFLAIPQNFNWDKKAKSYLWFPDIREWQDIYVPDGWDDNTDNTDNTLERVSRLEVLVSTGTTGPTAIKE